MGRLPVFSDLKPKAGRQLDVSRREVLHEALRAWRAAEQDLASSGGGVEREANVARLRDGYQRLYTEGMVDNLARLHQAEDRRSRSVPSTPEFHAATQDTEKLPSMLAWSKRLRTRPTPMPSRSRKSRSWHGKRSRPRNVPRSGLRRLPTGQGPSLPISATRSSATRGTPRRTRGRPRLKLASTITRPRSRRDGDWPRTPPTGADRRTT